jgi:ubiquinone/menaquinone biosynthesis C-methylase UbiE
MSRVAGGARLDPKRANAAYHDAVASGYDRKWAISFDQRSRRYVRELAGWMLPGTRYGRVLDVGAGTGFLLLNLWQEGMVQEAHALDISPGMLSVCVDNARQIGCDVQVRVGDIEALPYPDGFFDLVVGHAVLHHIPDVRAALREVHRVLAPGGALFVAGEPTLRGDRRARKVGRVTHQAVRAVATVLPPLRPTPAGGPPSDDERIANELQWEVDLHTFVPEMVSKLLLDVGFRSVRVETDELISSVWGWAVRTLEAVLPDGVLGRRWATFAYRSWSALSAIDRWLYRLMPKDRFYNLLLYGERGA